jgi:two-component system, chemotaxis family, sensor kinase Cph1
MSNVVSVDFPDGAAPRPAALTSLPRRTHGRRHDDRQPAPTRAESEALAAAESILAQRDRMIAVFGHDLRGLLNALTINAELLLRREGKPALESADVVRRTIGRMDQLVSSLLDYVKVKADKLNMTFRPVDAAEMIREAVDIFRPLADVKSLSIVLCLTQGPLWAIADRDRLFQVLSNLLSNAIKFSNPKGQITLQATSTDQDLCVAIRDEGIGIPEGDLDRVFDCFHQLDGRDARGLGLGLYISKSIVLAHGGRIWVTSRLGAESTFHFTIPLAPRDSAVQSRVAASWA